MKSVRENPTRSSSETRTTNSAGNALEGKARAANQQRLWALITVVALASLVATLGAHAQTFTTLATFPSNGALPSGYVNGLVQATDGNFYGTDSLGGAYDQGSVFRITLLGVMTVIHSFCYQYEGTCSDGTNPVGNLVQGDDGYLYGTTLLGGGGCDLERFVGCGIVFKISLDGKNYTILHNFDGYYTDGCYPAEGLVQGSDGYFYGTTHGNCDVPGTFYKISPSGELTVIENFCSQLGCGEDTFSFGGFILGFEGNLFGEGSGGKNGQVVSLTPGGVESAIYSFLGAPDGSKPGDLVQGANGELYGITAAGGEANLGTVFQLCASEHKEVTMHSFAGPPNDGEPATLTAPDTCNGPEDVSCSSPAGSLVAATDGNLYGTTYHGGPAACSGQSGKGCGTIFKIVPPNKETILHFFSNGSDGANPDFLLQGTDGNFYGTTPGSIFRLETGLAPFVETRPVSAEVDANVIILGNNLSGATSVWFAGTPANFTVVSNTEITATVPVGAKTGKLRVETPTRALLSNVPFHVMPQITGFSPESGAVGTSVVITGESLSGAVAVAFGGRAASFIVDSDTEITAKIPSGAVSGKIGTQTPGGYGQSPTNFTVTP